MPSVVDRIAFLKQRAEQRAPLFDRQPGGIVLQAEFWIARNGWRHLIRQTKLVNGREVEELLLHPTQDERRLAMCQEKRDYRKAHLEAIRAADRRRKERSRDERKRQRRLRKIGAPRTGKIHSRAELGQESLTA
jgi:hypothetical protein